MINNEEIHKAEKDGDKMYNTCPIFDPKGNLIAKHRKVHLFDSICISKKFKFKLLLMINY